MTQALEEKGEVHNLEVRFRARTGREITGLLSAEYIEINGNQCVLTLFKDIQNGPIWRRSSDIRRRTPP